MKVRDKNFKKNVDVYNADCLKKACYWPRPDPGNFIQGQGYRSRGTVGDDRWLCGTREVHGCPDDDE